MPVSPLSRLDSHLADYYCDGESDDPSILSLRGALAQGTGDAAELAELVGDLIDLDTRYEDDTQAARDAQAHWAARVRDAV